MKLLFVCTENLQRSPTAALLFKKTKHLVKSAGISLTAEKRLTKQAIIWADIIFVMEDMHKKYILDNFPEAKDKEIKVLNIPDIYMKNNPELIKILKEKLKEFLK